MAAATCPSLVSRISPSALTPLRVAEHRVHDRAGPVVRGPPAEHHQVGAGRQAGQRPARVAVDKVLADRDIGVLCPPAVQ